MPTSNKMLFEKYISKMTSLNRFNVSKDIYNAFLNGKNSYLRLTRSESSHFDPTWIKVVEDCLFDLGDIVNNPRQVTKTQSDVVPVELAKKINGQSVTHLASHTQYIKDIAENGDVIPSKILSHYNEDDIHTYENRFIATFIRRLVLFIQKRYDFIIKTIPDCVDEVLIIKNNTVINGQQVEIETKVRVKRESEDDVSIAAKAYAERIKKIMSYTTYYYTSSFMKAMKNEKDVRKPIIQTNIIRKNPKYRKCYETFTFIEKYDSLGVTYKVDEKYSDFDQKEKEDLNYLFLSSYLAVKDTRLFNKVKSSGKTYKPRIKTSIDDEKFVFGELYKGPIEFVRVDEEYRKYLNSLIDNNLPAHPTKVEKEYYQAEYQRRKEIKEELRQIDRLILRKQKEVAKFEKEVQRLIAEREREEARLAKLIAQAKMEEEQRRIEAKRQEIIAAALQKEAEIQEILRQEKEELERLERLKAQSELESKIIDSELDDPNVIKEYGFEEAVQEQYIENTEESHNAFEETPFDDDSEEPAVTETPVEEETPVVEEEPQPAVEEVPVVEEPIVEETAVEKPQEPTTEEPQPVKEKKVRKRRAKKEQAEPQPEVVDVVPVVEEVPVVAETVAAEESLFNETPVVEEIKSEEPVVELKEAPAEEVVLSEEKPLEEQPKAEKVRKTRAKKVKEVKEVEPAVVVEPQPVVEEAPVVEETPVGEEAPIVKEIGEPVQEETPVIEEPVVEQPQETVKEVETVKEKKARKPRAKKETKPAKPAEEKPKAKVSKQPEILDVIPGKFIVKAYEGYYINDKHFSVYKKDATIFNDFNKAKLIKARFGGKVIKL